MKYYTLDKINEKEALYNIIIGERSNGKTYALLKQSLERYWEDGGKFAYVRRWKEDIIGRRAATLFSALNNNGEVAKITNGTFEGIHYYAGGFYLCIYDEKGKPVYSSENSIGHTFALTTAEHDKSTSFPRITTVIFDEFLTNRLHLKDEFILFMNVVSTIVRKRGDVKIYMLGNTVNQHSPYFDEMGLNHVADMEQGTIDVYDYGESGLNVAVEYCSSSEVVGKSNKYFAFDNPKLAMITGGSWEIGIYNHRPFAYDSSNVALTFYILFDEKTYSCDIVEYERQYFIYIYLDTLANPKFETDLIYSSKVSPRLNIVRSIHEPTGVAQNRIRWFFTTGRVFYESNAIGNAIHNFLMESTHV